MRRLTATAEEAAVLADRISPYGLPIHIPAPAQNARLRALAADGYSSVIRLPLRNEDAARTTLKPSIRPRHRTCRCSVLGSPGHTPARRRRRRRVAGPPQPHPPGTASRDRGAGIATHEVVLGEGQRDLGLTRLIHRGAFLSAIQASIESTLVDESWREREAMHR